MARSLGYVFVDSGAMYRAVTLYLMWNRLTLESIDQNPSFLKNIQISFKYNDDADFYEIYLNNILVENEIRSMEVSNYVSEVSTSKAIRAFLIQQQRKMAKSKGVVMDGRDIGTVVLPDAELKIFMTADPYIRAQRRFEEMLHKRIPGSFEEIYENLKLRDDMDTNRAESPLLKAEDAIILDNTNMSREQQTKVAMSWANGVIAIQQ